jgi:chromosomal replication initiator protein
LRASSAGVLSALEESIRQRIGAARFNLWFQPHTRFQLVEDQLVVGVPNRHFQEWLQKTFGAAVLEAVREVRGQSVEVKFVIDPLLFRGAREDQQGVDPMADPSSSGPPPVGASADADPLAPAIANSAGPRQRSLFPEEIEEVEREAPAAAAKPAAPRRRWRRLEEFVVGACNRVAHAAALALVEASAEVPSPLVLHGPVGTGKTHLLEGIYVGLRKALPRSRICFTTAEDFTNRFVQAVRLGKLGAFRKHFRESDALLVDDLHFLASKKATQEEFLHTFDVLLAEGRAVVVTCDCHPRLSGELAPEMIDRLLGGSIWSLQPPDAASRLDILRRKTMRWTGPGVSDEVLRFLAGELRGNVRELEGALHGIRHFSRVAGRPVNVSLVREALGDLLRHSVRIIRLGDIDRAVATVLRLDTGALQSRRRAWTVSHPRMLAMYLARKHTSLAYSEIGKHFGSRNHSTVVAAEKTVRRWLESDGELLLGERKQKVREILELIERELLR